MTQSTTKLLGILLILIGTHSCASLTPIGTENGFHLEGDEKRLWNRGREEQTRLDHSGQLYEDPILTAYVNRIAAKLTPETLRQRGITFQVKIIKNPLMNAFALPHGAIYLHTGLLAKMENEAQLATILGHEMSHVVRRHAVKQIRTIQNAAGTLAALQIALMPLGVYGSLGSILGAVGAVAAVSGYSKGSEEESDEEGLALTVAAGYDPREAPRLFDYMKRDLEENKITEPFFFGSHPRIAERKYSYERLLQEKYGKSEGLKAEEEFTEKTSGLLLDNAALDLSLGRFALAQEAIERYLQRQPGSAAAHFYLGEVWRQRNREGDLQRAENEYRESIDRDSSLAQAHKGLGLIWLKRGEKQNAKEAFEKYLSIAPRANDKGYIEQYLKEILNGEAIRP